MDNYSGNLCRNPGFYIANPAEDHFILIGETESFLLRGRHYSELFQHIDGTKTIQDMISGSNDILKQTVLLKAVDELIQKGIVFEKNGNKRDTVYFEPDFGLQPLIWRFYDDLLEIRILSEFEDPEFLVQWAKQLNITRPTGVVIADDYLDPRLNEINRSYLLEKRDWLLIKPTGKQPLIGPFFTPENQSTPCWHCLSHRISHNQPVRQWLQGKQKNGMVRITVCYEKETVKKVIDASLKPAQEWIDRQISPVLKAVDPANLSFTDHPVSVIPQCPCCGDPDISASKSQRTITLKPCPKSHTTDGGFRSQNPLKTIERLVHSISPITGIIGDLSLLPDQKEKGVPIYRSFFFKTPGFSQKPENFDFIQISLGKGMSEEQSKASALCESVERHAVQYRGDEPKIFSSALDMNVQAVLPHELACFSEKQYQQFSDQGHPDSGASHAVKKYHGDIPLNWTPAWSLADGQPYYIPLTYCYANTPFEEACFCRFNSNGCAAGNTLEEAILQGLLELVERDAIAVWWYNKIIRPQVELDMLSEKNTRLLHQTLADEWDYWVLDITHDFQIPVMVAVAKHKKNKTYRLGFGCHIHPVLACQRSLTELCQLIAIKNRGVAVFDFDHIVDEPFLLPKDNAPAKKQSDFILVEHSDIRNDIFYCAKKAADLGLKTLVVDYTRPDIPIHTARVIIPGLCHIWPQFGNIRLYSVPVSMGWNSAPLSEDQLNRLALLI